MENRRGLAYIFSILLFLNNFTPAIRASFLGSYNYFSRQPAVPKEDVERMFLNSTQQPFSFGSELENDGLLSEEMNLIQAGFDTLLSVSTPQQFHDELKELYEVAYHSRRTRTGDYVTASREADLIVRAVLQYLYSKHPHLQNLGPPVDQALFSWLRSSLEATINEGINYGHQIGAKSIQFGSDLLNNATNILGSNPNGLQPQQQASQSAGGGSWWWPSWGGATTSSTNNETSYSRSSEHSYRESPSTSSGPTTATKVEEFRVSRNGPASDPNSSAVATRDRHPQAALFPQITDVTLSDYERLGESSRKLVLDIVSDLQTANSLEDFSAKLRLHQNTHHAADEVIMKFRKDGLHLHALEWDEYLQKIALVFYADQLGGQFGKPAMLQYRDWKSFPQYQEEEARMRSGTELSSGATFSSTKPSPASDPNSSAVATRDRHPQAALFPQITNVTLSDYERLGESSRKLVLDIVSDLQTANSLEDFSEKLRRHQNTHHAPDEVIMKFRKDGLHLHALEWDEYLQKIALVFYADQLGGQFGKPAMLQYRDWKSFPEYQEEEARMRNATNSSANVVSQVTRSPESSASTTGLRQTAAPADQIQQISYAKDQIDWEQRNAQRPTNSLDSTNQASQGSDSMDGQEMSTIADREKWESEWARQSSQQATHLTNQSAEKDNSSNNQGFSTWDDREKWESENASGTSQTNVATSPPSTSSKTDGLWQTATSYFDTIVTKGDSSAYELLNTAIKGGAIALAATVIFGGLVWAVYNYEKIFNYAKSSISYLKSFVVGTVEQATTQTADMISKLFWLLSFDAILRRWSPLPQALGTRIADWVRDKIPIRDYVGYVTQAVAMNQVNNLGAILKLTPTILDQNKWETIRIQEPELSDEESNQSPDSIQQSQGILTPQVKPIFIPHLQPTLTPQLQPVLTPQLQPTLTPRLQLTPTPHLHPTLILRPNPVVALNPQVILRPQIQPTAQPPPPESSKPTPKVQEKEVKILPPKVGEKVINQIIRESISTSLTEDFINQSNLKHHEPSMDHIRSLAQTKSLSFQVRMAFVLGRSDKSGCFLELRPNGQDEEYVNGYFLEFYRRMIHAYFPRDPVSHKTIEDQRILLKRSEAAFQKYCSEAPSDISHQPKVHLQLMDIYLEEGRCLLANSPQARTCTLAKQLFEKLVENQYYEDIESAVAPRLVLLRKKYFSGDEGMILSFLGALRSDPAMLMVGLKEVGIFYKRTIKKLNCRGSAACAILIDAFTEEGKFETDIPACNTAKNSPEYAEAFSKRGEIMGELAKSSSKFRQIYGKLLNWQKPRLIIAFISWKFGINPDDLEKVAKYEDGFSDNFNAEISKYCKKKSSTPFAQLSMNDMTSFQNN